MTVEDARAGAARLGGELTADLCSLIAIPSVGGSPAEHQAQEWVAARLASLGLPVQTWRTPWRELTDAPGFPGAEVARDSVTGVLAAIEGTTPHRTLLLGHTDVVPASDWPQAFQPERSRDRVIGRGAVDMKSGVAAMIHVARVLTALRITPPRTVLLATVSGEEDGGAGTFDLLRRRGDVADECLVPEPTGADLVVANAGALGFRIVVHGRSAHAARRWEGSDSLAAVAAIHRALRTLEAETGLGADALLRHWPIPYPTVLGTVAGGDWSSTVMASAVLTGRYGVALGAALPEARARFQDAVAAAVRRADPEVTADVIWEGGQFAPARQDPAHPAVARLAAAHRAVTGTEAVVGGTTYGSDLRLLLSAGIPAMLYGAPDAHAAHAADESVALADVLATAQVLLAWLLSD